MKASTLPIYADELRSDLKQRLGRAGGQVQGIARMLDEDRPCLEVLQQLANTQAALRKVSNVILRNYLERCATDAIRSKDPGVYDQLMEAIHKFAR